MSDYLKTMLQDVPSDIDSTRMTPAAAHLFKVNQDDPKALPPDMKTILVHLVMQELYLSQHG